MRNYLTKLDSPDKNYKVICLNLREFAMGSPMIGFCRLIYQGPPRIIKKWDIKLVNSDFIHTIDNENLCIYRGSLAKKYIQFSLKSHLGNNEILYGKLEDWLFGINKKKFFNELLENVSAKSNLTLEEEIIIREVISSTYFQRINLSNGATLPFAWSNDSRKIAFPEWSRTTNSYEMTLNVFDVTNYQMSIYETYFSLMNIISFNNNIIYHEFGEFNILTEKVRSIFRFC